MTGPAWRAEGGGGGHSTRRTGTDKQAVARADSLAVALVGQVGFMREVPHVLGIVLAGGEGSGFIR